jgi:hypothetical protein
VRPTSPLAHANLGTVLYDAGEVASARAHWEEALRLDSKNEAAHQGLAILLLRSNDALSASRHGELGFGGGVQTWPFRGTGRPISLLVTFSALGGNLPIDRFLDDRLFQKITLVPEFFRPGSPLPPHDLILNGIGDADRCGAALEGARRALEACTAPVLNAPARVQLTSRAANATRLATLPGVVTARTVEWRREELSTPDAPSALERAGFTWPVLVRSPGFHTGFHFEKVDSPDRLRRAVETLPGERVLTLQFADTRGADGKFRKYRVMMVNGQLFPLHLAISSRWKVHYLTADMADEPAHRAEDAAFLHDMAGTLGPSVLATIERIRDTLGLDYGGIDFGIDAQGRVVVFEANATMVLLPPPTEEKWSYRVEPVDRVRRAVSRMLFERAGRPVPAPFLEQT